MTVSKKTILAAAGIGGGYKGDAYEVLITSDAGDTLKPFYISMSDKGQVAINYSDNNPSNDYYTYTLLNDIGEEEWSKYTFVGSLTTKPGALCFDNEYVYSMNEYYNNQWHDGKFALSDGTYTNLGYIDAATFQSNSRLEHLRPFKAAAIGDYIYCAGYKNGDDYLAIYSIAKDLTSDNFYITDSVHANIGTSRDGLKCVSFTDNGGGQGTVTYGQGFNAVGDSGAYLTLDLDNGSCSFNISKEVAGSAAPLDNDHIGACVTDSEGNTYVVGQIRAMSSNYQTYFIKFNSSGVAQWIKMLSGISVNDKSKPKFDGYICSQGNIHLAYWMYEPSLSWTPSVQITTFDSSGNLISITRVQVGGNYLDAQQDMVMENDGFAMISPEQISSGNEIVVLRFPLNTDISYTSSYVKIEYDTTRTWSDGNSSEFSISNGYSELNIRTGTRYSPSSRSTYNESGNTITTTEITY